MASEYDIAVSFAGEDRALVEQFVHALKDNKVSVFSNNWDQANLIGKDLYRYLDEIYGTEARYCGIFASRAYISKAWTRHELRSARKRAFKEHAEYILPIRIDDAEIPGLPSTIAYLSLKSLRIEEAARIVWEKLQQAVPQPDLKASLLSGDAKSRRQALSRIAIERLAGFNAEIGSLMLQYPVSEVLATAAWALDNVNHPEAAPLFLKALNDDSADVRSAAGWGLVHIGSSVLEAVRNILLSSQNPDARFMAKLVLDRLH